MKSLVVLVFGLALLELGSALKCYTCDKGLCNKTQVCTTEDSCLSASSGVNKYKQCLKYDDCNVMKLLQMFPGSQEIQFKCCTSDMCNAASLSVASHLVLGLLLSIALFWWGVLL